MLPRQLLTLLSLTLVALGLLVAPPGLGASAPASPVSVFQADADGWDVQHQAAEWRHETGYLWARGRAVGEPWYWEAPAKFTGNQSAAFGGGLQFDLQDDVLNGPRADGPAVILEGNGVTLACAKPREARYEPWTRYSAALQPGRWRVLPSGEVADTGTLLSVLSNLERLLIRGIRHATALEGRLLRVALDTPATGERVLAAADSGLAVSRVRIDFGEQPARFAPRPEDVETLSVTNLGDAPLEVGLTCTSPTIFAASVDEVPLPLSGGAESLTRTLAPTASLSIQIAYHPEQVGRKNTGAVYVHAPGLRKPLRALLVGKGSIPIFAPKFKAFGKVVVPTRKDVTFKLENRTGQIVPLYFDPLEAPFSSSPTGKVFVSPGDTTVKVSYMPRGRGKHDATLVIRDGGDGPPRFEPLSMPLHGEGIGEPKLQVLSSPLDFGTVDLGQEALLPLSIGNVGGADLEVTLPATLPEPYHWVETPPNPLVIHPLDPPVEFRIAYQPTSNFDRQDRQFSIGSNDAAYRRRSFTVQLLGAGRMGPIPFHWQPLEFGSVPRNLRQERPLQISRDQLEGGTDVIVEQPIGNPSEWGHNGSTERQTVPAGKPLVIPVWFEPQSLGNRSTTLTIVVLRKGQPDLRIPVALNGAGIVPPPRR